MRKLLVLALLGMGVSGFGQQDEADFGKVVPPKQAMAHALKERLADQPNVTALSAVVIDRKSRRIIWGKLPHAHHFPASCTKIMTGYLLATLTKPGEIIVAPPDTKKVTGSSLHLLPGEKLSSEDMLFGMMLRSANDGCHAVAMQLGGSEQGFASMMNEEAQKWGCRDTHFVNPNGLPNKDHFTSAFDLAVMASHALTNPRFALAVKTRTRILKRSLNKRDVKVVNRNRALLLDPSTVGVKTGFTNDAGKCFVGATSRPGGSLITVVLKSKDWLADHLVLTEWAYAHTRTKVLVTKGDVLGKIAIVGGDKNGYEVAAQRGVSVLSLKGDHEKPRVTVVAYSRLSAPIKAGARVGNATLTLKDGTEFTVPLTVVDPVRQVSMLKTIGAPVGLSLLLMMGGGAYYMRRKSYGSYLPPSRRR